MLADELLHQLDAARLLAHLDDHATATQQLFFSQESAIFADDNSWDAVEQDGAGAHGTRRQSGVQHALAVNRGRLSSGILQRVHLAVENGAAALDTAVVSAAEDLSLVDKDRTDRNAAFRQ